MRLFDSDHVGCYLDTIGHRVERTKEGIETKMIDLTLRVQPLTPELASALDPDVRALLFTLGQAEPKPKIQAVHFALTVPRQQIAIRALPEVEHGLVLADCEIDGVRARTERGVDGYALVFYVSYGPASPAELEYVCDWLTQQRFLTFEPQAPALDFGAKPEPDEPPAPAPPSRRRARTESTPFAGDELRPGVHAEH